MTPGGATCATYARSASKIRSGSWFGTSRQLILAWAWAGMIVFEPSPWNPPQMPVDVERRPGAAPLERREAGLADELRQAEPRAVRLLVERQRGELRALLVGERHDVVVEARDARSGRRGP